MVPSADRCSTCSAPGKGARDACPYCGATLADQREAATSAGFVAAFIRARGRASAPEVAREGHAQDRHTELLLELQHEERRFQDRRLEACRLVGGELHVPSEGQMAYLLLVTGLGVVVLLGAGLSGSVTAAVFGLALTLGGGVGAAIERARLHHWQDVHRDHASRVGQLESQLRALSFAADASSPRTDAGASRR